MHGVEDVGLGPLRPRVGPVVVGHEGRVELFELAAAEAELVDPNAGILLDPSV
jgi:hypothetical protein